MIMKDGHFGLQRFSKVDDPDDISLLSGRGLFPPDAPYNHFVRNVVAYSDEVNLPFLCFLSPDLAYITSVSENHMFKV
jgi:hypothetical protein